MSLGTNEWILLFIPIPLFSLLEWKLFYYQKQRSCKSKLLFLLNKRKLKLKLKCAFSIHEYFVWHKTELYIYRLSQAGLGKCFCSRVGVTGCIIHWMYHHDTIQRLCSTANESKEICQSPYTQEKKGNPNLLPFFPCWPASYTFCYREDAGFSGFFLIHPCPLLFSSLLPPLTIKQMLF